MFCPKCMTSRVAVIDAKCSDCCSVSVEGKQQFGYVPRDMNIGGGDYIHLTLCLKCGFVVGEWPLPECSIENQRDD